MDLAERHAEVRDIRTAEASRIASWLTANAPPLAPLVRELSDLASSSPTASVTMEWFVERADAFLALRAIPFSSGPSPTDLIPALL
jgi:hypothetical protein